MQLRTKQDESHFRSLPLSHLAAILGNVYPVQGRINKLFCSVVWLWHTIFFTWARAGVAFFIVYTEIQLFTQF